MRHARRTAWQGKGALGVLLAGSLSLGSLGCHQHHYYYTTPSACPPGTTILPSAVAVGPVCDVSSGVVAGDAPIVASSPRSTVVHDGRKSRVVVSEPARSRSRFSWRSSDPESIPAITQVEGAIEDSSVHQ